MSHLKYVYLGKIVNTHGIRGEVRILSDFLFKDAVFQKHRKFYIGKHKISKKLILKKRCSFFLLNTLAKIASTAVAVTPNV